MRVNQQGNPIEERVIDFSDLTLEERKEAVDMLFDHLGILIIRTNATKDGSTQLLLHVRR